MHEKMKPCPNPICKSEELSVIVEDSECAHCFCTSCGVCGPTSAQGHFGAISAWNSLPRAPRITPNDADCKGCPERRPPQPALTWTDESPKEAGWYWHHIPPHFGMGIEWIDPEDQEPGDGEWAGPIPLPEEDEK